MSDLFPADPKELQNDGDPIQGTHEVWLACDRCGCRHSRKVSCPSKEEAAARRAYDASVAQLQKDPMSGK